MNNVEIYVKSYCPFWHRAKALLDARGIQYQAYEIGDNATLQRKMIKRSGRRTVPQVFINNQHIGGSDDLAIAEKSGLLDEMLSSPVAASA